MLSHTRAIVAACAFAILTGKKVAGMYDHASRRSLKIAAERRGQTVLAFDGARGVNFGGTLPELYDAGDESFVSFEVSDTEIRGHDRKSGSDFSARASDGVIQLYDYSVRTWFSYDIQDPNAASSFHRR